MKKTRVFVFSAFLFVLFAAKSLTGIDIIYEGKTRLEQREGFFIDFPRGFVVTEKGFVIVSDARAGDFKIFDAEGQAARVFGRKGYGPGDFVEPWLQDYKNGKLLISDMGTKKLFIYNIDKDLNFQQIKQTIVTSVLEARLIDEKDKVLIARLPITDKNADKAYVLFAIDMTNGSRDYLLPYELQLGEGVKPIDFKKLIAKEIPGIFLT